MDLGKTLKRYKGTSWDQSPLFKKYLRRRIRSVRRRAVRLPRGRLLLRPHAAGRRAAGRDGKVSAAAAHTPFIAGALADVDADGLLAGARQSARSRPRSSRRPSTRRGVRLRESEDARYIGLAMPRFLSRLPYGAKTNPVEEFDFEEDTGAADHSRYTWAKRSLRDGGEHQPLLQALRVVLADSRHRVRRRGGGAARAHVPDR